MSGNEELGTGSKESAPASDEQLCRWIGSLLARADEDDEAFELLVAMARAAGIESGRTERIVQKVMQRIQEES